MFVVSCAYPTVMPVMHAKTCAVKLLTAWYPKAFGV